jgi:TolB-like protein
MTKRIILLLALLIVLGACKSQAPVIEANYQAQSLDVQLNNLTNQMVRSLSQERKSKIAIMEFPDLNGNISEFGKFIPEELTTRLFMTRKFEVLERQLLNKVLEEQNLGMTGLIDASSAARIGKVLGVDAIVTGTITDMGNMIRINARMIATETAGVFAVASVSIEKEPHIAAMMNRFSASPTQPTPSRPEAGISPAHTLPPTPTAPREQMQPLPVAKAALDEFEFEVVGASLTSDMRIIVDVLITNTSNRDKEVSIKNDTTLYDNLGQEFKYPFRRIGNKEASMYSHLTHLFISNVPTRVSIEFRNTDPDATSVALLNLSLANLRGDVQFRNFLLNK